MANIIGVGVATLFRLYTYRRWVFLAARGEPLRAEQLEPETSGTEQRRRLTAGYGQPRTADRSSGRR